jgi:putative ABC transport system permease protein
MSTFLQDLRYALRMLAKSPSFTAIAVLALALGIGANAAIFSVVNAVVLRPLPYKSPNELVWLWGTNPQSEIAKETASYPDFNDWRQQAQSFSAMAGFTASSAILGGGDGEAERLRAGFAAGDLFSVLGVEPMIGRKFLEEENVTGKNRVVLLSHALWQRRFGGDARIVGEQITINNNPHTVIGVLPPTFQDPLPEQSARLEMWLPLGVTEQMQQARRSDFLNVAARLKPGVTLQQAQAEMTGIMARLEQQYPNTNNGWSVIVQPLHETITGDVRPALLVLLGAVSVLLLIACANVANLLLARATARQREIAIRSALGASRKRIVVQLLTENVVLSLVGGIVGLLFAYWGLSALLALAPANIPRLHTVSIDQTVLLFALAVSLGTGLLFGLAPALTVSQTQLNDSLKEGGRSGAEGGAARRLRGGLAVTEIALSFVLLAGAGLLIRSFFQLQNVDPGFNAEQTLTVKLALPSSKYSEDQQVVNFYDRLLSLLATQPGVQVAAVTNSLPLDSGAAYNSFVVEGRIPAPTDRQPDAETRNVHPDYFRALQIPLKRGRLLEDRDAGDAPDVVVIGETMAKKYFGGEDPIGKRITFGDPQSPEAEWFTVVGIVGDVRGASLQEEPYAQVYRSYRQTTSRAMTLVIRAAGDPLSLVGTVRQQVAALDAQQPLYDIRTGDQVMAGAVARNRFNMLLIAILAGIALLLAAIGVYGVISYSVAQRTREIGVRMALGASAGNVLKLVVGEGMLLAGTGIAVGLVAAFACTRIMASLLYGVTATDPVTFVSLALLLAAIAFLASYIPARRATKVDPAIALRTE